MRDCSKSKWDYFPVMTSDSTLIELEDVIYSFSNGVLVYIHCIANELILFVLAVLVFGLILVLPACPSPRLVFL